MRVYYCDMFRAYACREKTLIPIDRMRLLSAATVLWLLQTLLLPEMSGDAILAARRAAWKQCLSFSPHEETVSLPLALSLLNPHQLDPGKEAFAQNTLLKRLPDVAMRLIEDGVVDDAAGTLLRALAAEVPTHVPVRSPAEVSAVIVGADAPFCANFNGKWNRWTTDRSACKDWSLAMPLISLQMYFYIYIYIYMYIYVYTHIYIYAAAFWIALVTLGQRAERAGEEGEQEGGAVLKDPFQGMKSEALTSAMSDVLKSTLEKHLTFVRAVVAGGSLADYWADDTGRKNKFYSALASTNLPAFFGVRICTERCSQGLPVGQQR